MSATVVILIIHLAGTAATAAFLIPREIKNPLPSGRQWGLVVLFTVFWPLGWLLMAASILVKWVQS